MARSRVGRSAAVAGLLALAGAGGAAAQQPPAAEEEGGSTLMNILRYGGTTVPPVAPPPVDQAYCPAVDVAEGGASLPAGGRGGLIALGQLGRECAARPDGSVSVKLGIQGRALLGPSGVPGRFEAPVFVAIKRENAVVAVRTRRVAITVPPGAAQGSFTLVEDGLIVPPAAARDYEIEVGFGSGPRGASAAKAPRRRARTAAQPG